MAGVDNRTVNISGCPVMKEYTSAVTLTVGMVVELDANGQLALSSVASPIYTGGEMVVTEAPERGKGVYASGTTEATYVAGEQVPTIAPYRGCEVLLLLTSGQVITPGELLEIAATGKAISAAGTNLASYRAKEALSPSQDALIWAQRL